MGGRFEGWERWSMVLGIVVVLVMGACGPTQPAVQSSTVGLPPATLIPGPTVGQPTLSDSTECTMQAVSFTDPNKRNAFVIDCRRRFRLVRALKAPIHGLAELNLLIPEFHDEQPFANSATEYGPVVMGFASPFLGGFVADSQWGEHGARGVLSALVMVDPLDTRPLGPSYQRLGLHSGVNCLWVSSPATAGAAWRAYVTWPVADGACEPSTNRQDLAVVRTVATKGDRVPAVTRFTWDSNGRPLIGVRCLSGWCDVGPLGDGEVPGFTPRNRISGVSVVDRAQLIALLGGTTALDVPGWYDEQPLSGFDAGGKAIPGTLWATVLPTRLGYRPMSAIVDKEPEAVVYVHGSSVGTPYGPAGNWDLKPGINIIAWKSAPFGGALTVTSTSVPGGAVVEWKNTYRHFHHDAAVVSTARFRWASSDDGIWVACGQACCRVDGKG